jgi:HJR/Mrr/RecB family endonuclease
MKNQKNGFDIFIEKTYLFLKNKLNLDDIQAIVITASLVLLPITYFFGIGYTQINELRIAFFITVGLDVLTIIYSIVKAKYFNNKRILFVKELEEQIERNGKIEIKNINDLQNLNGVGFEYFAKEFFIRNGHNIISHKKSHDRGADLVMEKDNKLYVVQAKHYNKSVTKDAVVEAFKAKKGYKADVAILFTSNETTLTAEDYAKDLEIEIINRIEISNYLRKNDPIVIKKSSM